MSTKLRVRLPHSISTFSADVDSFSPVEGQSAVNMSQSDIRPASPFEEVSSEYADLLLGLGDEDLNDFDGLDDFGDGMGFKVQVALGRGEGTSPSVFSSSLSSSS